MKAAGATDGWLSIYADIESECPLLLGFAPPKGRLVYTGPSRELGADLDTFEERLVQLLVSGATPTFQSSGS